MRTFYVVGRPLRVKMSKGKFPYPQAFSVEDILEDIHEDVQVPLYIFSDYQSAEDEAKLLVGTVHAPNVVAPIYTVQIPPSVQSKSYPSNGKRCILMNQIARNVVEAQFREVYLPNVELPKQKRYAACLAYFEDMFQASSIEFQDRLGQSLPFELNPGEVYPMLSDVFDQLYPEGQLSKADAEKFYKIASAIVRQHAEELSKTNVSWATFWTFVCCVPIVTIPFVLLVFPVYDAILRRLEKNDPIQTQYVFAGKGGDGRGALAKIVAVADETVIRKASLFSNKSGQDELRKIRDDSASTDEPRKWICSRGQLGRHGFYSREDFEKGKVAIDDKGIPFQPLR